MFGRTFASALFAFGISASAADDIPNALPVRLCDVIDAPGAYADRPVRFHATIESDIHTALLRDASCSRGLRFSLKFAAPVASANAIQVVVSSPDGTFGLQVEGEFVATVKTRDFGKFQVPYLLEISTIIEFSIRNR